MKPPSGARNRFALRMAGHQSPRHGCAGWDRMGFYRVSYLKCAMIAILKVMSVRRCKEFLDIFYAFIWLFQKYSVVLHIKNKH